ncbi:MAG: YmdB family metallophosphoesterase [Clostridia bacterium]|nr:YmdB family metallophosphoesterase [Clostridia bacterium]
MLRIMAIGDITSPAAAEWLASRLWDIRKEHAIDFLLVNAENAGFVMGPSADTAKNLLESGADVVTGGNHTLQNFALHNMLEANSRVLRPINLPAAAPGVGYTVAEAKGYRVLVINAMGRVHMDVPADSPFEAIDKVLKREAGRYDIALLDFHAETTGEKLALGHYLDGRAAAVFGTHTHVPTADLQILPKGTGFVSDLGMCGADGGIMGIKAETVIHRYLTALPARFQAAEGAFFADAVLFEVDEGQNKALSLSRLKIQ